MSKLNPLRVLLNDDADHKLHDGAPIVPFLLVPLAVAALAFASSLRAAALAATLLPPYLFFVGGRMSYRIPLRPARTACVVAGVMASCGLVVRILGDPGGLLLMAAAAVDGIATYGGIAGARDYRRWLAGPAAECARCKYSLAGLPAIGVCPECGQTYRIPRGAALRP